MSKTPLPPPPGFTREKREFGSSKRYVYPFAESDLGWKAELIQRWFLDGEEQLWKESRLRQIAIKHGRAAIKSQQRVSERVSNEQALKLGMTLVSMHYPLFMRRNPLDQVFEHMRHQPRYFMKIDIADAFGCVYPGFHNSFSVLDLGLPTDLFAWTEQQSTRKWWDGWPFFHPGTGGLIQGAPASPLLFEKACALSGLDQILRDTALANNATVTRYVDDIVFSRKPYDGRPFGDRVYKTLKRKITSCGFVVNECKSRRVDTRFKPIEFLGVRVLRNRVRVRPAFFVRLATLGFMGEGHVQWLEQVEETRRALQLQRNIKTSRQ